MSYSYLPPQSLWEYGHEFSIERQSKCMSLFMYRNYSDCTQDNKHVLISTQNNSLIQKINQSLAASIIQFNTRQ